MDPERNSTDFPTPNASKSLFWFRVGWLERAAIDHAVGSAIAERRSETSADELDAAIGVTDEQAGEASP